MALVTDLFRTPRDQREQLLPKSTKTKFANNFNGHVFKVELQIKVNSETMLYSPQQMTCCPRLSFSNRKQLSSSEGLKMDRKFQLTADRKQNIDIEAFDLTVT
jgi:hypothetical protein